MADGDCGSFVASKPCPFCGGALTTRFGPREVEGGRRAFLYCQADQAAWELDLVGAVAYSDAYERAMAAARRTMAVSHTVLAHPQALNSRAPARPKAAAELRRRY